VNDLGEGNRDLQSREMQNGSKSVLRGAANVECSWFVIGIIEGFEV
jgi:hypothetical protein